MKSRWTDDICLYRLKQVVGQQRSVATVEGSVMVVNYDSLSLSRIKLFDDFIQLQKLMWGLEHRRLWPLIFRPP